MAKKFRRSRTIDIIKSVEWLLKKERCRGDAATSIMTGQTTGHTIATHDDGTGTTFEIKETITDFDAATVDNTDILNPIITLPYNKEDGTQQDVSFTFSIPSPVSVVNSIDLQLTGTDLTVILDYTDDNGNNQVISDTTPIDLSAFQDYIEDINLDVPNQEIDFSGIGNAFNGSLDLSPLLIPLQSPWDDSAGNPADQSSTSINYSNGNVGIGTLSPNAKLEIANISSGNYFNLSSFIGANGDIYNITIQGRHYSNISNGGLSDTAHFTNIAASRSAQYEMYQFNGSNHGWFTRDYPYGEFGIRSSTHLRLVANNNNSLYCASDGRVGINVGRDIEIVGFHNNIPTRFRVASITNEVTRFSTTQTTGRSRYTAGGDKGFHFEYGQDTNNDVFVSLNLQHGISQSNSKPLHIRELNTISGTANPFGFNTDPNNNRAVYDFQGSLSAVDEQTVAYFHHRFGSDITTDSITKVSIGSGSTERAKVDFRVNHRVAASGYGELTIVTHGIATTGVDEHEFFFDRNGKFTTQRLNISNLPTSTAGLVAGDIWNDAGTLKVV